MKFEFLSLDFILPSGTISCLFLYNKFYKMEAPIKHYNRAEYIETVKQ